MKEMKPHIVLDLDNTLLCAETLKDFPFSDMALRQKALSLNFHNMDGYYIVFERPYLQPFLDFLFKNFDVSVWTAASKDYGLFVINKILLRNNTRQLKYYLFSYHCELSEKNYEYVKDLRIVTTFFNCIQNPLIIDDLREVYEAQPRNCINIKAFRFMDPGSENDRELVKIQEFLSQYLKTPSAPPNTNPPNTTPLTSSIPPTGNTIPAPSTLTFPSTSIVTSNGLLPTVSGITLPSSIPVVNV